MNRDYWPTGEWKSRDPAGVGMEELADLEKEIVSGYSNINGIVVVRRGYVAYERYFNGFGPTG